MKKLITALSMTILLTGCLQSTTLSEEDKALPESPATSFERSAIDIDDDQSYLAFTGTKNSLAASHQGEFENFEVDISLDEDEPNNLEKATIEVSIDITSITSDLDAVTAHLKRDDYFDAEQFPEASFTSTSISSTGENDFAITGDLTIKDITQNITFDAIITNDYATFTHDLQRLDFGIGEANHVDPIVPLEAKLIFK